MTAPHAAALLLSAVFFASGPALAQIYRWVDEKGVTHYGQRPEGGGATSAREMNMKDPTGGEKPAEQAPSTTRTYTRSDNGSVTVTEQSNETQQQRQEREFQQRHSQRVKDMDADARGRNSQLAAERNSKRASCDRAQRHLASTSLRHPQQRRDYEAIISRDC